MLMTAILEKAHFKGYYLIYLLCRLMQLNIFNLNFKKIHISSDHHAEFDLDHQIIFLTQLIMCLLLAM